MLSCFFTPNSDPYRPNVAVIITTHHTRSGYSLLLSNFGDPMQTVALVSLSYYLSERSSTQSGPLPL